jgi:hypothetical protein
MQQNLTLTPRMIRDILALNGPMGNFELTAKLHERKVNVSANTVMSLILELQQKGQVSFNYETGRWESSIKLV